LRKKPFDEGTIAIAQAVAEATEKGATSIVGGGDSVAAINQAGLAGKISHISTGGGATLEFFQATRFRASRLWMISNKLGHYGNTKIKN
jgi:3-phosphoglycerate kinase